MSIFWKTDWAGSDGDAIYGRLRVNQWQNRESFEHALDLEIARCRADMLTEFEHMQAEDDA
jgi:hypothetical protein